MTLDQMCALRHGTPVRLADGRVGRIVVWHKAAGAVGIEVPGMPGFRSVSCGDLTLDAIGDVAETTPHTPDPPAHHVPRTRDVASRRYKTSDGQEATEE